MFSSSMPAFWAVVVFVVGQLIIRMLVEPILAQRKTIGEIAYHLVYFANASELAGFTKETHPQAVHNDPVEVVRKIRGLASELRASLAIIPAYGVLQRLGMVLPDRDVLAASAAMIGWSNSVRTGSTGDAWDRVAHHLRIRHKA